MESSITELLSRIKKEYLLEKNLYDNLIALNCKLKNQFNLSLGTLPDNDYSKVPDLIFARMVNIFDELINALLCGNVRSYNALARMFLENTISILVILSDESTQTGKNWYQIQIEQGFNLFKDFKLKENVDEPYKKRLCKLMQLEDNKNNYYWASDLLNDKNPSFKKLLKYVVTVYNNDNEEHILDSKILYAEFSIFSHYSHSNSSIFYGYSSNNLLFVISSILRYLKISLSLKHFKYISKEVVHLIEEMLEYIHDRNEGATLFDEEI